MHGRDSGSGSGSAGAPVLTLAQVELSQVDPSQSTCETMELEAAQAAQATVREHMPVSRMVAWRRRRLWLRLCQRRSSSVTAPLKPPRQGLGVAAWGGKGASRSDALRMRSDHARERSICECFCSCRRCACRVDDLHLMGVPSDVTGSRGAARPSHTRCARVSQCRHARRATRSRRHRTGLCRWQSRFKRQVGGDTAR